jgi:hypothetical protein
VNNLKLIIDNKHDPVPENDNPQEQFFPLVGLGLGSFLQAISMDQQTCVLEIRRGSDRGSFYFIQGSLYDAVCGNLEGQDAAMELVSWEGIQFNIRKIADKSRVSRKINKSLISLLMESTRQRDEKGSPELDPDDVAEGKGEGLDYSAGNGNAAISGETAGDTADVPSSDAGTDIRIVLQQCIDRLAGEMQDALIRSVIIDFKSGEVLAGQGVKLFALDYYAEINRTFGRIVKDQAAEPGRYFLLNVDDSRTIIFLNIHQIRWVIDFDSRKMKLGVFMNIMAPKLIDWCEGAFAAANVMH